MIRPGPGYHDPYGKRRRTRSTRLRSSPSPAVEGVARGDTALWQGRGRAPAPRRRAAARGRAPRPLVDLDAHRGREAAAERVQVLAEPHRQRPAERLAFDDLEGIAEPDSALVEVAEHLRVGVRDADEAAGAARLQRLERM